MRGSEAVATAACLMALAACGQTAPPAPSSQGDRQWIDNISGVIDQLVRDMGLSASGGDTIGAARMALHDQSSLYTILVAYTDFGGCDHMVASAGQPPVRFAKLGRTLAGACALLQRAAVLFTQANSQNDPRALLAATRLTLRATPLLIRASAELATGGKT
jgi:hypothetical protein